MSNDHAPTDSTGTTLSGGWKPRSLLDTFWFDHDDPDEWYSRPIWGPWALYRRGRVLANIIHTYEIDLDRCTTPARVLDQICRVVGIKGADAECLGGLVHALDDILKPQATMCNPDGRYRELTLGHLRELVNRRAIAADHEIPAVETLTRAGGIQIP